MNRRTLAAAAATTLLLAAVTATANQLRSGATPPRALAQGGLTEAWRLAATWDGNKGQSAPGAVLYPAGIDIAGDKVYLVDQGNDRVQRFNIAGAVETTWGSPGTELANLRQPQDVAVDGNRFYVTDRGNGRVVVFDTAGQALAAWAPAGLSEPWGVAAAGGRVYVSQPSTGEVLVLQDGAVAARWPGMNRPKGLAVGTDGRVYVADEGASAVRIFTPAGVAAGRLDTNLAPLDVAVDERGDLYVMAEGAILWFQAGKQDSTQALYYKGLTGVAVTSKQGVFGAVARDARDPRDRTFHGVVRWPWRPQNVSPTAEWPLLGYPIGRLHGPLAISAGGDGRLWVLDGWPRAQAFAPDGTVARQFAPTGLGVGADIGAAANGEVLIGEPRRLVRLKPDGTITTTVTLNEGVKRYWLTALALRPDGAQATMLDAGLLHVRDYGISRTMAQVDSWPIGDATQWRLYWDLAVPVPNPAKRVYLVNRSQKQIEVFESGLRRATWPVDGIPVRVSVGADGAPFVLTAEGLVWKLDAAGKAIAGWDASAFSVGKTDVVDLTVGPDGRVYTVDRAANVIRVWERDPNGVPEPPLVQRGACRVRVDKSAVPEAIVLGDEVTVALEVGGDCPSSAPQADILLAIDRSGSMNEGQKITDTRKAAAAFIDAIDLERDRVGIVAFNNGGEVVQPLTNDRAAAKAVIAGLQALGGTNIANAFEVAAGELFGPRGRPATQPVIILLTDGRDREPENALRAGEAAKARGARVFTIGFGDVDPMVMVLSATTPEEFFYAPDSATLGDIYTTIARRITANVLARSMTVTDDLPADMRYVTSVAGPPPVVTGQRLTWQLTDVPFAGLRLAYTVRPSQEGHRPTNVQAEAQFTDGLDRPGRARFPVPFVDVLVSTPTPRPTNTPFPTNTPVPTWTPTPRPAEPIFLPITLMQKCEDRTIHADVAIVLDTSGSMLEVSYPGGPTKMAAALDAARVFIEKLALPNDRAALVSFNTEAKLVQGLTGDKGALLNALGGIQTLTGTRIDLGLDAARVELTGPNSPPDRNKVIVLLTDGNPTGVTPADVLVAADKAKTLGIKVYSIGLGSDLDAALLRMAASGSSYFFLAPSTNELQAIYANIATTIQCANLTWPAVPAGLAPTGR
jgi:YVTN family beta-propeller protein